ncbi:MAG: hypothetical protein DELT_00473 [Desulfovibrio sp.]
MSSEKTLAIPQEGFIRLPQLLHLLGIKKSKMWQMVKDEKFPSPKKLGKRTSVWDIGEVRAAIERISREGSI